MSAIQDNPTEKRAIQLRFSRTHDQCDELAFLEEYLQWKAKGGPARFDAQRDADRQREIQREARSRMNRRRNAR